ncbi:hypothetical protein POL68_42425 [Stigmatella sp. ncwal1]|uniref:DUF2383 domain-containing protein n=1 Tax=Stigmatella ashevillensis TaxID=2995309 RepID=A0ABT5DNF9_9BACT|nr:hypothetical protein [Stigmatella ashevillena]MDC0715181.1 hypothetical protein [Stigmatella ashevillena]
MNVKLLGIYLNDHLAGSRFGLDLASRAARRNRGNAVGDFLSTLQTGLEQDRAVLERVMQGLSIPRDRLKEGTAWAVAWMERLKPNGGGLTGYSPLSRVMDLEALCIGTRGRICMWRALERLSRTEPRLAGMDFAACIERAEEQLKMLEQLRLRAADTAFASEPLPSGASIPAR